MLDQMSGTTYPTCDSVLLTIWQQHGNKVKKNIRELVTQFSENQLYIWRGFKPRKEIYSLIELVQSVLDE